MNDFLNSLKSDLLDRRIIPLLGLLGVVLIGAIAYAAMSGGSGTPAPLAPSASATSTTAGASIAASAVSTDAKAPVAETTSGSPQRTSGSSRNPFAPVKGAKAGKSAKAAGEGSSSAATGSGASGSSSGSSSGAAGGSEAQSGSESGSPEESSASQKSGSSGSSQSGGTNSGQKKSSKTTPKVIYKADAQFGVATPGTPPASAGLTPYENLKRQQPLPSAQQPLVVFRGVLAGGKSAAFTLVGEAILRGSATCLPSASQCQAIELKPGQTEELEYIPLGASAVTYQLQLLSIGSSKAKAAAARVAFVGESKTGLALLRDAGLLGLPGMHYSAAKGVLVLAQAHPLAARAHVAAWLTALKG